jgi:hypothetical protein
MRIRDPGSRDGNNSDPGSDMEKSRIRDKHSGSATLKTTKLLSMPCPFYGRETLEREGICFRLTWPDHEIRCCGGRVLALLDT